MAHGTTRNFLVPADGRTHTVWTQFIASAIPYEINWDEFAVNNFKFYPQGAYVNNTAGAADLVVTITPINYTFVVGAGETKVVQFPAPIANSGASIVGSGTALIHWVDYPTFPDSNGVNIINSAGDPLYVAPATGAQFPVSIVQTPDVNIAVQPYGVEPNNWRYAAAAGGIVNSTANVAAKAAFATGFNYVTAIQFSADVLTNATELVIRDGAATVLWRTKIQTTGIADTISIDFPTPLKGSLNTAINIATLTASGAGAVYCNLQGYQSTV